MHVLKKETFLQEADASEFQENLEEIRDAVYINVNLQQQEVLRMV